MGVVPRMLGLEAAFTGRLIMCKKGLEGGRRVFLGGATSLLAVLHRIFLADAFVEGRFSPVFVFLSSHTRSHCSLTMNEAVVLHMNVAFNHEVCSSKVQLSDLTWFGRQCRILSC